MRPALALAITFLAAPAALFAQLTPVSLHVRDAVASSSLISDATDTPDAPAADTGTGALPEPVTRTLLHSLGYSVVVGLNGIGLDVALPVAQKFNVRVGGSYFAYTGNFETDGARIAAALTLGGGKAALDWFPFGNGIRVSPMLVFAIQTDVNATVLVPSGQSITLNGKDYVSSTTNPLSGSAHITTRNVAPGLSIGFGNIAPHGNRRLSFPVEIGAYYIGQPGLKVTFTGSACDPTQPPAIGCQDVTKDADFQKSLQGFIARNNNNVSYASFYPVASIGVGYRF